MLQRIIALVIKELQTLVQDRQGRMLLIGPVLMQLAIFPFAATLEVKNNTLAVCNQDSGAQAIELMERLAQAKAFPKMILVHSEAAARELIDRQDALIVVRIPQEFSREFEAHRPVALQAILDGRRSNSSQIALGYVRRILQGFLDECGGGYASRVGADIVVRHWFNPNLKYVRHIIPSLVAIITTISALVVTSLSLAREREHGTFDQLLVSPLTPGMIMLGKSVPALIVAMLQATVILSAGVFIYQIPFQGSLLLLYACMAVYIMSLAGFGLLISSLCSTQQQAFLGTFSFMMPAVLLSGFPSPVENMPKWLRMLDWFNPLQHFIVIVKGVFLKDVAPAILLQSLWPLLLIAAATLTLADWMFRKRLG